LDYYDVTLLNGLIYPKIKIRYLFAMYFDLVNRPVLVIGYGVSGRAMAKCCARLGAEVIMTDTRAITPQAEIELIEELKLIAPQRNHRFVPSLLGSDLVHLHPWALICKSPGLSPEQLKSIVTEASRMRIPICGELILFINQIKKIYASAKQKPKILAITGTNGKTTTTSLVGHLLKYIGWYPVVAGNIGPSMLNVLSDISINRLPDTWVLELSSFQLDGIENRFEPDAAVILNITQDHLDWHESMVAYTEAKYQVFGKQSIQVLNRQDAIVMAAPSSAQPRLTFGTDCPKSEGDWGLDTYNGVTWLVRAVKAKTTMPDGQDASPASLVIERLVPTSALHIRGQHNATNALAALALCTAIGAPLHRLLEGLNHYHGEPHRVQSIAIIDGIEFFDDSKGTNVGATLAAIQGLRSEKKLVLILGGDGKGQDFSPLIPAVRTYVKEVVLIGKDASRIRSTLADTSVPMFNAADMFSAVIRAAQQAVPGDAVLLSPACASLDMFSNYVHRAEVFCQAVQYWSTHRASTGDIR
jgi:UDP-N-acetylmuramoylalanine--D-glutamate ligase